MSPSVRKSCCPAGMRRTKMAKMIWRARPQARRVQRDRRPVPGEETPMSDDEDEADEAAEALDQREGVGHSDRRQLVADGGDQFLALGPGQER